MMQQTLPASKETQQPYPVSKSSLCLSVFFKAPLVKKIKTHEETVKAYEALLDSVYREETRDCFRNKFLTLLNQFDNNTLTPELQLAFEQLIQQLEWIKAARLEINAQPCGTTL